MIFQMIDFFRRKKTRARMVRDGIIPEPPVPEEDRSVGWKSSRVLTCIIVVAMCCISSLLLTWAQNIPQNRDLPVVGQKAPVTINAAFDFSCENPTETGNARKKAREESPLFFSISAEANAALKARFDRFFDAVRNHQDKAAERGPAAKLPDAERELFLEYIRDPSTRRSLDDELNELLESGIIGRAALAKLPRSAKVRIRDMQKRDRLPRPATELLTPETAAAQLAATLMRFRAAGPDAELRRKAVTAVFLPLIGPNGTLRPEPGLTKEAAEAAAGKIDPVVSEYRKYQVIVRKGDVIDAGRRELLERYHAEEKKRGGSLNNWSRLQQNMIWSAVLILLGAFYLNHLHRDAIKSNDNLAILASIILLSLGAELAAIWGFRFFSGSSPTMKPELVFDAVPVGLASVLLAPIMGFRVALCGGFYTASMAAQMLELPFEYALKGLAISCLCALAVRDTTGSFFGKTRQAATSLLAMRHKTNYRSYLLQTIIIVFLLVWGANFDIFLAQRNAHEPIRQLVCQTGVLAILNGIATGMFALLTIAIYEQFFHVSTDMSLMVLCDGSHELLERMKRDASGTFFHSLIVATLAEDAARAIGANYPRAKAGALFHDIGKLAHPEYFIENNPNSANLHNALIPQMSSIIIRDHIKKEGLKLARQYKLPRVVRDAIAQHHGKDLVHYFYYKAQENSRRTDEPVDEKDFRYEGPRPQTKEIAIISLADACEAACRSLENPTVEELKAQIDKIFEQRIMDGQLAEADITLAELEKVRETFVKTLPNMKHGRIAYPEKKEEEKEDHAEPLPVDPVRSAPAEKS